MKNFYESLYHEPKHTRSRSLISSVTFTILIIIVGVFLLGWVILAGGDYAVKKDLESKGLHSYWPE